MYIVTLLFNLYAEYIMRNIGLEEAYDGIHVDIWQNQYNIVKLKNKKRLLGEISITSDMQMTPSLWQKVKKN